MNWQFWKRKKEPELTFVEAVSQVYNGMMYVLGTCFNVLGNFLEAATAPFLILAEAMDTVPYPLEEWPYLAQVMAAMTMFDGDD